MPLLQDATLPGKDWEITQLQYGISLRTDQYRYTELRDGVMLYDLFADPNEWHNLAGKPEFAKQEERLRQMLKTITQ